MGDRYPGQEGQYVYVFRRADGCYKIGRTWHLEARRATFQRGTGAAVVSIYAACTGDAVGFEATLHALFADKRATGEWFWLAPDDLRQIGELSPNLLDEHGRLPRKPQPAITPDQRMEALRLYDAHQAIAAAEVGRRFGVTGTTVRKWLAKREAYRSKAARQGGSDGQQ